MTADEAPTSSLSAADARRTARNIGALMVASVLSKGILFAWQIVLANWLGSTQNGIYATVVSLMAVGTSLSNFGIGVIAIRDIARAPDQAGRYWAAMLTLQTGLSALAYAAAITGGVLAGYGDLIMGYAAIAGLSLLVDNFGNIANDLLIAQERMVATSAIEIVHILLRVGLASLALSGGYGLLGVYGATLLVGMLRALALNALVMWPGLRPHFPVGAGLSLTLLVNAAPLAVTAFLKLAYDHADKLMTTALVGVTSTGFLAPAFTINFGVIELISTTVLIAVYPLMSRYYGDGKNAMFGFMVEKLTRFTLIITLPIALALSIYADVLVALIFSPEYAPTAGILRVLIWYTLLTVIGNVPAQGMMVQNKQRRLMLIRVGGLALNLTLNAVLLLQFRDPRGAAVASVLSEMVIVGLLLAQFTALGWDWRTVRRSLARVLLAGLATGTIMLGIGLIHPLLGLITGLMIYVVIILFGRTLQDDDWDLLYRLLAAMPGGSLIRRVWHRDISLNW